MGRSFLKILYIFFSSVLTMIFCMTVRSSRFVRTGYVQGIFSITHKINVVPYQFHSLVECGKICSTLADSCVRFEFHKHPEDYRGECTLFKSGAMCLDNGSVNLAYRDCYKLEYKKYEDGCCTCAVGYFGNDDQCCKNVIKDCTEGYNHQHLQDKGDMISYIKPRNYTKPFEVQCHFGYGGLTYIQVRRKEDVVDFNRSWEKYKQGFGNIESTYWLGLEKIVAILNNWGSYQLDVSMQNVNMSCTLYISNFRMRSEEEDYAIEFDTNSIRKCKDSYLSPTSFSTYDHDTTGTNNNCSLRMKSGWWFDDNPNCNMVNLNTPYYSAFTSLQLKRV